jgi:hypothetical protein
MAAQAEADLWHNFAQNITTNVSRIIKSGSIVEQQNQSNILWADTWGY